MVFKKFLGNYLDTTGTTVDAPDPEFIYEVAENSKRRFKFMDEDVISTAGALFALAVPARSHPGVDACLAEYVLAGRLVRVIQHAVAYRADQFGVRGRFEPIYIKVCHLGRSCYQLWNTK